MQNACDHVNVNINVNSYTIVVLQCL